MYVEQKIMSGESTSKMVVKNPDSDEDNNQLQLMELSNFVKSITNDPAYVPSSVELTKIAQETMNCLVHEHDNEEQMWTPIRSVEEYMLSIVNSVSDSVRSEIISAIINKFYSVISDPQTEAGPATSVVLIVFAGSENDVMMSESRRLVQQNESGPSSAGLKAALACLYKWMCQWRYTQNLGDWVMSFIKALEENWKFEILMEVSVNNLVRMFLVMSDPEFDSENVAEVIFHVLASLRESMEAFEKISPHVNDVLTYLATESGHWSRHLLETLVDILTTMLNNLTSSFKGDLAAKESFKDKHFESIFCLARHMASRTHIYKQTRPWRIRPASPAILNPNPKAANNAVAKRKVGLVNLGNTCYINSVMQALLVTKQFSTHVMLRMTEAPYWSRVAKLFAKMIHSVTTKLNPGDFCTIIQPPFFTANNQHDSSEFLGWLLVLLESYEYASDRNHDYSRPAVISSAARLPCPSLGNRHSPVSEVSATNISTQGESSPNTRRSVSPRPGSSVEESIQTRKRTAGVESETPTPKKRIKIVASFIDNIFSGVLLTRIECTACHSTSLSRDMFRDLQLAFPDKPEGKAHTVQSLLEFYCSLESMTGDNQYFCHDCGGLRDAERRVLVETTPKYLILVLKHFKFEAKQLRQTKLALTTLIDMIINLPTVGDPNQTSDYFLYAAVVHEGRSLDSGHYYAVGKDNDDWYMFNDETVTAAAEGQIYSPYMFNDAPFKLTNDNKMNPYISKTPYILFYRRSDVDEGATPALEDLPPVLQETVKSHNKAYYRCVRDICCL